MGQTVDTDARLADAYRRGVLDGSWNPDKSRHILRQGSSFAAMVKAIAKVNQDPAVRSALDAMIAKDPQPDQGDSRKPVQNGPKVAKGITFEDMAPHFALRIKSLKYISAVDRGAQGPISDVALIKRAQSDDPNVYGDVEAVCKVAGLDEKMGLVFGWALATTTDGGATPHVDLQNDAIIGGDELIKVAAEFMEKSRASDVLHDDKPDGQVVFAMPLTKDVKSALGLKSDVEGLAIAMRPSPATFKRFVSKELNAFSIGGTGERTIVKGDDGEDDTASPVKGKKNKRPMFGKPGKGDDGDPTAYKRVGKMAVLTSEDEGHQHSLDLNAPAECWTSNLGTSMQTMDGADQPHSHAWVYDAVTRMITIASDSGHSHTVTAMVPADVLARAAERDAEKDEDDGKACTPCAMEDEKSGKVVVEVHARAPHSPQFSATPTVSKQEPVMPTEQETQIANLRKMLDASLALPDAHRLHIAKLSPANLETFLQMDSAARDVVVKTAEAADPEVYKTANGVSIRKSHGPVAEMLAKQADEQSLIVKAQADEIAKAKAREEQTAIEKRASVELSHFAKGLSVRGRILKAIQNEFTVEAERTEAIECLKGANFALAKLGAPSGADDHAGPAADDPQTQLDAMAKKYATDNKVDVAKAYTAVLDTADGASLYAKISTLRAV